MDYIYLEDTLDPVISKLQDNNVFSYDIETTGLSPIDSRILLAQIGFQDSTYVINCASVKLEPLMPYLKSRAWLKIIQNAKFESRFMKYMYGTDINNVFDTFIAEFILDSNTKSASLKNLAFKYTGKTLNKDIRTSFHTSKFNSAFSSEQLQYAADDVIILTPIYNQQSKLIQDKNLTKISEIEFDLTTVVADMENTGIPIDTAKWRTKIKDYAQKHEESRLKMNSIIFDDNGLDEQLGFFVRDGLNLNSPKQLKEFFSKMGVDVDSTNEREIALINHPAAKELLVYRKYQKILSSYGTTFLDAIHPFTNRIHPDFQQMGTATGRFSCKEPNVQQMPDEFRQCVSLKDHKLVVADYSQIELRILAELSQDKMFLEAFNSGKDLHKSTAAAMFNIPLESVDTEKRFIAKTINFGISYGMGVTKLADILNSGKPPKEQLPINTVKNIMSRYKSTYHSVSEWLRAAGERAYVEGYSETMMGRRRTLFRPTAGSDDYEQQVASIKRQGANSPIQGTNADITKLAMVDLYNNLNTYGYMANIVVQVHDEIVVLAHKRQAESVKELVLDSMTQSAQRVLKTVPIKVDAYISDTWKKG